MKKVIIVLMSLIILMNIFPVKAVERTVRVAYPIQPGLTEMKEDGLYSGYTYEYLKEITRFTNWKLEFVRLEGDINEQIKSAMEKVKTGELDLMGAIVYSNTLINDYDYSAVNYGMGNMAIYVKSDNAEINDTSIYSIKNLDVGIVSTKREVNISLRDFGDINGIEIKQHFYSSTSELRAALEIGEIDAMVLSDLSVEEGDYRVVVRFSPKPFYFVTTKGNKELMSELNEAMAQLSKEQPNYMSNLHEKYFSLANDKFILTEAEKKFIEENPKINVLLLGGRAPLQYYDEKRQKAVGITVDVLNYIGDMSGLKFEYLYASTSDEYNKLLGKNEAKIIGGVYKNNPDKYNTSKSYLESGMSLIANKKIDVKKLSNKQIAMIKDVEFDSVAIDKNADMISYYDTQLECIRAVENGEVDYTYMNNHIALFYNSSYDLNNINIIPQGNQQMQGTYFAIDNTVSEELLTIINKGIDVVSYNKIEDIIFTNVNMDENKVTFFNYVKNNPIQVIVFLALSALTITLFFLIWRNYVNKQNNEIILKEYNRYQKISELSRDCFVEYNIKKDTLVLMGGGAKLISRNAVIGNYLNNNTPYQTILLETLKTLKKCETEQCITLLDGQEQWIKVNLQPIFDELNVATHVIGKITDIQAEKEEQLLWRDLAQRDSLTKIYNSAACREKSEKFLKENKETVLMIIDVDNFKEINDNYGHLCGDIVLKKIAHILKNIDSSIDIFGRVGGDEFLILFKYPGSFELVRKYCSKMIQGALKVKYQDKEIKTSVSIGGVISKIYSTYDELYELADEALYVVKNHGRNNFRIILKEDQILFLK